MKKLTAAFLFLTALTACKKDHSCYCEYYSNGELQGTNTTPFHETKAKANKKCKDLNDSATLTFGGMTLQNETRCELKN